MKKILDGIHREYPLVDGDLRECERAKHNMIFLLRQLERT